MNKKEATLSVQVYQWIQNKYDAHDQLAGRDCGDEHTEEIFIKTRQHFKLTKKKVQELYDSYGYANEFLINVEYKKIGSISVQKAIALNGKRVKLKVDKILEGGDRSNPIFIDFVKENNNTVFTAITDSNNEVMYNLKEDGFWLFREKDLEEVVED